MRDEILQRFCHLKETLETFSTCLTLSRHYTRYQRPLYWFWWHLTSREHSTSPEAAGTAVERALNLGPCTLVEEIGLGGFATDEEVNTVAVERFAADHGKEVDTEKAAKRAGLPHH